MEHVYLWNNGAGGTQWTLESMFALGTRYQVLCQTQDEYDLLRGYSLMFGRELELDIFRKWLTKRGMRQLQSHHDHSKMPLRLLPVVFTTWPSVNLRGL